MTRSEIIELCRQYGAIEPPRMYHVVHYALRCGGDPSTIFAQLAKHQPTMFHPIKRRAIVAQPTTLGA
jgi:hypothetical protein